MNIQIAASFVISAVLFASLIIYISKHPQKRTIPLKTAFIIMFLGGMLLYCYCHYWELEIASRSEVVRPSLAWVKNNDSPLIRVAYIVITSVMDVGMMFYGRGNSDVFYNLPEAKNPVAVLLFWIINLIAFYTAATALLIRFGNDLLRWIRTITTKISDVNLVFGINQNSIALGRNLSDNRGSILVYVDRMAPEDYEASIRTLGGISYSDNDALKAAPSFLRAIRIKPHKTKLKLYALSDEYDRNLYYARMMLESLQKTNISPEQTGLVLLGTDEWKGMMFQSSSQQYGYGNVISFDKFEMSARLLMNKYPLCNAINFDSSGRAVDDMNVLIVGFGRIGHEVLRKVIANGQFEGSRFHATVYDPNFAQRTGFYMAQYPMMFANYDIDFEPHGGRGTQIFQFIKENAENLKYIVVCLDDRDTARDIAVHIVDRLQALGYSRNVYTCDTESIRCYSQYARECETYWLYDSELLYSGEIDEYAMKLNHKYTGGKDIYQDWKQCGYFERMSSRASVDYLVPLIRRVMINSNSGTLTTEQRENLSRSEHLRWCAFYYTFGFDVMDKDEFIERVKARQSELREYGQSSIKVTNDKKALKHVCLVDWDELDEVSRIENSLTQGSKDYKEYDRMNVDIITGLVQDAEGRA